MLIVHCGAGNQKVGWLSDVAVHRYDPNFGLDAGMVHDIKLEGGVIANMGGIISEDLTDDAHVFVQLQGK